MTSKAAFVAKLNEEKQERGYEGQRVDGTPSVRGRTPHQFQGWQILSSRVAKIRFQFEQAILLLS